MTTVNGAIPGEQVRNGLPLARPYVWRGGSEGTGPDLSKNQRQLLRVLTRPRTLGELPSILPGQRGGWSAEGLRRTAGSLCQLGLAEARNTVTAASYGWS